MPDKPEVAGATPRCSLRPVAHADDAAIGTSLAQTYEAVAAGHLLRRHELGRTTVVYAQPRAAYFVVSHCGRIAGGGGFGPLAGARPEVCELRDLWLLPEVRGRGAAFELVEHCLVVALAFGYRHGYAEILHTLRPAAALLGRAGFSVLNQPVGRSGRYLCDRWYLRDL